MGGPGSGRKKGSGKGVSTGKVGKAIGVKPKNMSAGYKKWLKTPAGKATARSVVKR